MRNKLFNKLVLVTLLVCTYHVEADVYYAKVTASGTGDGESWINADTLSNLLDEDDPDDRVNAGDEVWVQAGTYGSIVLFNGVKLYGGFAGTETLASQSDPSANQTVIDGGGNSRAVTSVDHASSTVLRGFRLTNGSNDAHREGGGGIWLLNSSTLVVQCVFDNNLATWFGAAASITGTGSPQFINCIFHDNGLVPPVNPTKENVKPYGGGAVTVHSGSPTFTNCLFYNNNSGSGGSVAVLNGLSTFYNCTITENNTSVDYGAGIHDQEGKVILKNCIVWNNDAALAGPTGDQIFNRPGVRSAVTYSDIQSGWSGSANIDSDPVFSNASSHDYTLQDTSPCRNSGNKLDLPLDIGDLDWDGNVTEKLPLDLALRLRTLQFKVEMGAYEVPMGGQY